VLASARLGNDMAVARDKARVADTVADLVRVWLGEAAHLNRRTGAARSERSLAGEVGRIEAHVLPLLGSRRLADVSRADIERFRDQVARGATRATRKTKLRGRARVRGGPGTAARTVRLLSSIFAFAVDRRLVPDNPCRGVRLAPARAMDRFLSSEELARLGEALRRFESEGGHPSSAAIIRLLALTGARRSEITGLRWSEVDLEHGLLRLATTKTGPKTILLSPGACAVLAAQLPHSGSDFVFPASHGKTPHGNLGRAWAGIRIRADLKDVRLHDLRHTFASFGAAGGFGLPVIGALLGHRQPATTARYAHLADDPVRRAAYRIGNEIGDAMESTATTRARA